MSLNAVKTFLLGLFFSEKAKWEREKKTFTEVKTKLEEQKQVDDVKVQQFNVSQINKYLKDY